jgi:hypothetical protein
MIRKNKKIIEKNDKKMIRKNKKNDKKMIRK